MDVEIVNADIMGADIVGADIMGADIVGADIVGAGIVGIEIVQQKGHYCLAVKTNQAILHGEIKDYFSYAQKEDPEKLSVYQTIEKDHGRMEKRKYQYFRGCSFELIHDIILMQGNNIIKGKVILYE